MDLISNKNGDGKDGKDDDLKIAYLDVVIKNDTKINYILSKHTMQGYICVKFDASIPVSQQN